MFQRVHPGNFASLIILINAPTNRRAAIQTAKNTIPKTVIAPRMYARHPPDDGAIKPQPTEADANRLAGHGNQVKMNTHV